MPSNNTKNRHVPPAEYHGIPWAQWVTLFPKIEDLAAGRPMFWDNIHSLTAASAITSSGFTAQDVEDASMRLARFAPLIAVLFPETGEAGGIIESPLREIPAFKALLDKRYRLPPERRLLVKLDSELPIGGSVKARGGIYEVLKLAEDLAMQAQLLKWSDDYSKLAGPEFRELFGRHGISVGSTGNLGLAVGMMGRALGFKVRVHMSREGREWKKALLRSVGAEVLEHDADFGEAVRLGREEAAADQTWHFVDDENSRTLFLGYATAAKRLRDQLAAMKLPVDGEHPLHVYLPCGVGGAPGGICFGLKLIFREYARCCFVEPVNAPAMALGLGTGLFHDTSVQEIGLSGITAADGLAVSRPSKLVCRAIAELVDDCATVEDDGLFRLLTLLYDTEGIKLEPAALAAAAGYIGTMRLGELDILARGTHILWATGGGLVPEEEWRAYYEKGKAMLSGGSGV